MVLESIVILPKRLVTIQKLDNVNVLQSSRKRSFQVYTLVELEKCVNIDGRNVHVDPNALFLRLVVLLERSEDVTPFFKFKLTPCPTSIFKNFQ